MGLERDVNVGLILVVALALAWEPIGTTSSPALAANPSTIYVYPYGSQHGQSFMASLSGVVARTSPEVFMAIQGSNPNHDPEFWLNKFVADNPSTNVVWQNSLLFYIDRYKDKLSGYVVYNDTTINEATSVSGALGAVMVHESLLPSINASLTAAGLSQVEDVRGRDSTWVFNNYGSMFNKDMIFRQNNTLVVQCPPAQLRDHEQGLHVRQHGRHAKHIP